MSGSRLWTHAILLAAMGLWLIWLGTTGRGKRDLFGELMVPRWAYIFAGLLFLMPHVLFFLLQTDFGRSLFGL